MFPVCFDLEFKKSNLFVNITQLFSQGLGTNQQKLCYRNGSLIQTDQNELTLSYHHFPG